MADFNKIAEHYPAVRDFRLDDVIAFRGDVLSYKANLATASFSIDAQGFRHSTLRGRTLSVVECTQSPRYGIVLGASNLFASGVAGNENSMASRLAERFDFPFANAAMPGGNSRNLNALLIGLMAGAKHPPAVVVLSNGGDLANFCESGFADPIFGSPNRMQLKAIKEMGLTARHDENLERLLTFTSLWTSATATVCRARKSALVMVHQSTFFEKSERTAVEVDCRLGEPGRPGQKGLFANFRKYNAPFFAKRRELAERFRIPIAGLGLSDRLSFLDEFHLDSQGIAILSQAVGDAIDPLLTSGGSLKKKAAKAS